MSEKTSPKYIVDCAGLHEIACTKSNSIKSTCLSYLSKGKIGVPSCVWKEFKELYEDEANLLETHISSKIKTTKKHLIGGAAIADGMNPGFQISPYNQMSDFYTVSIAAADGYTIITSKSQQSEYSKMNVSLTITIDKFKS